MISTEEARKVKQFLEHVSLSGSLVRVTNGIDVFTASLVGGDMNDQGLFMRFSNGVPIGYHPSQLASVMFSDKSLTLSGTNGAISINITIM